MSPALMTLVTKTVACGTCTAATPPSTSSASPLGCPSSALLGPLTCGFRQDPGLTPPPPPRAGGGPVPSWRGLLLGSLRGAWRIKLTVHATAGAGRAAPPRLRARRQGAAGGGGERRLGLTEALLASAEEG